MPNLCAGMPKLIYREILVAAADVFAENGYEARMEEIAFRADVGIGTLYRRFPHKADLYATVVDEATDRTRQIAEYVLTEVDPGVALYEFVWRCVDASSSWRTAVSPGPKSGKRSDRALAVLMPLVGRILETSQRAGTVRPDVVPTDVVVTLISVRALHDLCNAEAPGASRRFLELALDGMRPGNKSPGYAPTSVKQLRRVLANR